jgi:hypothetical protein
VNEEWLLLRECGRAAAVNDTDSSYSVKEYFAPDAYTNV